MERKNNPSAVAGFVLAMCAIPLLAAGWLCLSGVMLSPLIALVFGTMAGMLAAFGIALGGVGLYLAFNPDVRGAGFAIAALTSGAAILAIVLVFAALLILDGGQIFAGATTASQLIR